MTRIGIVGAGVIHAQYRETLLQVDGITIAAIADLDAQRAAEAAEAIPGARALTVAELFAADDIDMVLNLTIPAAHAEVAIAALAAGKHVYGEKPLAADFASAQAMVQSAKTAGGDGRWLGCAPDTVLGTALQTARKAVADGLIGTPVSATATFISRGHEAWHPNPDFYYLKGGGPVLDMGPYYLTALVHLLGPVSWVQSVGSRAADTRTIASGPRAGEQIPVDVDTHVTGVLRHESGALSTVTFSFDAVATLARPIEVHGTAGVLAVADPNFFDGTVQLRTKTGDEWHDLEVSAGYEQAGRGIAIVDAALGGFRADGELALHVLEIMTALTSGAEQRVALTTSPTVPDLVPFTPADTWRAIPTPRSSS